MIRVIFYNCQKYEYTMSECLNFSIGNKQIKFYFYEYFKQQIWVIILRVKKFIYNILTC